LNTTNNIAELAIISKLPSMELIDDGKHYKILYQNRAFIIGRILFQIIEQFKEGILFEEIVDTLYKNETYGIDKEKIHSLLLEKVEKFDAQLSNTSPNKRSNYISLKTKIANDWLVGILSDAFCFLFNQKLFRFIVALIITAQIFYATNGPEIPELFSISVLSKETLVIAYLLAIAVMLLHELGHAAAAKFYGVQPKEIGFGFYLIFPVFYADVTAVWKLDKYKRIIVNLGGVYFQFICNIVIIIYLCGFPDFSATLTTIFTFLYKVNIAVILYSLTPYFRNDGYWIYSDFFDLPNLNKRAYAYPKELFQTLKGLPETESKLSCLYKDISGKLPLFFYSITNYIVMTFFLLMFSKFLVITSGEIYHELFTLHSSLTTKLVLKIIFLIFSVCIMLYRFRTILTGLANNLVKRTTKLFKHLKYPSHA